MERKRKKEKEGERKKRKRRERERCVRVCRSERECAEVKRREG